MTTKVNLSADQAKETFLKTLRKSSGASFDDISKELGVAPLTVDMWLLTDRNFNRQVQSYIDNREGRNGS